MISAYANMKAIGIGINNMEKVRILIQMVPITGEILKMEFVKVKDCLCGQTEMNMKENEKMIGWRVKAHLFIMKVENSQVSSKIIAF